jgi:hypothetical protein
MYAQIIEGPTASERQDLLNQIVEEDLLPSLDEEPGFSGAVSLADPCSGSAITIIFWETAAQAFRPTSQYGARFRDALAATAKLSGQPLPPLSIWEVNARVQLAA